jgi:flavin-dependent dehydrogenase
MIVGGGPAGLSTWLHLRALAPDLAAAAIVIEKARHPREKLCGGAITPLGYRLLEGLGIALDVPAVVVDTIELRFGATIRHFRRPHSLQIVHRAEFDRALATVAVARGLDLREDETFERFDPADGGLRVHTSRGEYRVRALLGADGVFSRVRQCMRLGDESGLARLLEIVRPALEGRDPEFASRTAVFDFTSAVGGVQGYVWHFPCLRGGVASVNHGIFDARVHRERRRADLRAALGEALGERGISPTADWAGHPVRWLSDSDVLSAPHVFLVGDAAGVDAALGEGIAQALDYGDLAANVLIDAFRRDDLSFARYGAQLHGHPVGFGLGARRRLATEMYGEPVTLASLEAALTAWLRADDSWV